MFVITLMLMLTLIISMAIMLVSSLISKKMVSDREKGSPFECGFDPKGSARLPFSLRFFLITVIFLIFDVEITLLMPLAFILTVTNMFTWVWAGLSFLLILLAGLYYEWSQGALEWSD
uniref:NADH-ubiquinone oxidoreductase chain 3 n=1 Tax=Cambaroides schrenckii TaxID=301264 RepID=A0A1L6V0D4_9EUCA|nr:NADH dehydrogenase subunit 3 [Cambaroides schrenckii]